MTFEDDEVSIVVPSAVLVICQPRSPLVRMRHASPVLTIAPPQSIPRAGPLLFLSVSLFLAEALCPRSTRRA